MTPVTPGDGAPVARTYPDGFHEWPLEKRNIYFAKEAEIIAAKQKREAAAEALLDELVRTRKDPNAAGKQQATAEIAQFYPKATRASASKVSFKTLTEFCLEYEPLSYVVEGILREGFLYTATARTGAGKTALNIMATLAIATGRDDILGRKVTQGRVAYLACENPDDVRMRFMVAAKFWGLHWREFRDQIVIIDRREKPEDLCATLAKLSEAASFTLVIADTFAALFDGKDINNNVEAGEFMRGLRPLTQIKGRPSVLVSAHPVKNASEDNLVPYGGGAILNEVDGNLTLWKGEGGLVTLHHTKLRGIEFEPLPFQIQVSISHDVLDKEGKEIPLPIMLPGSERLAEERQEAAYSSHRKLLHAMIANPGASQRSWTVASGAKSAGTVNKKLQALKSEKLVEVTLGKWTVTAKGKEAAKGV
jgi:hypothetical protein